MIGTQVGSYRVVSALGGGGVAQVYRVQHTVLETWHAMKVLRAPSERARQRLVAEGRIQARLQHPNVVRVTDVLDLGGTPALLMELVDGPTLAALIDEGVRRPDVLDALAAGVLDGVAAAHAVGLVHRDLKPGNVLVAVENGVLVPKVADFGLARAMAPEGERMTRTGAALGTPLYMAPEQIRDARGADQRSDVWALGALLHELVVGEPPFPDTGDRLALFQRIDDAVVVPVAQLRPEVPPRWSEVVAAALQRDPADRPAEAGALRLRWGPVAPLAVDDELQALLERLTPRERGDAGQPSPETYGLSLDAGPTPPTYVPADELGASGVGRAPSEAPDTALASRSVELPVEASPAPASPTRWAPVLAAVVAAALGSVGTAWWLGRPPPAVPPPPPVPMQAVPAPTPAPESAYDRMERNRQAQVAKARDVLLEGDGDEAASMASMVVAGAATEEPDLVQAAGAWLEGRRGSVWGELGRGQPWRDPSSLAGAVLEAQVTPARAEALAALDTPEAQLLTLLAVPFGDGGAPLEAAAAWVEATPGRPLPLLAQAILARRAGDLVTAREALDAVVAMEPAGVRAQVEVGLLAAAEGRFDEAIEALDAAASVERPSPVVWVARGGLDARLGRAAALAADLDGVRRSSVYTQAHLRLAMADGHAAAGDLTAAFARLDEAEALLEPYGRGGEVNWLRVQVHTEALRLAVATGDTPRARAAATQLGALAEGEMVGWAEAEAHRRAAAGDAIVAWLRGAHGPLEALHTELTRAPDDAVVVQQLVEAVQAGRTRPRLHPSVLP